ncbi:PTS system, cellobiose-specific IIC component [Enterococcus mundtii 3F]|uniref:PTS sugar transporter subunit IIC n=1 Tax=Enterococcus mundtii TaxID=53346 RepID=UPI0023022E8C|nr:PTS transporter subunit EIIC [Enterococcus mundtii]MDA9460427.1 PTS system, cellobiose-specific IIC component [Enterococcus mundtii 3F]
MDKLMEFIETKIMPPMMKLSNQRHISAVRDGLIATIPITVIGSIFLLIPSIPWPQTYVEFMGNHPDLVAKLYLPFHMSMGLLSIYATFGIGARLAQSYQMDSLAGGISALFTFLTTLSFTFLEEGSFISTRYLGGEGMFSSILTAILAVECMRICKKYNIGFKLPEQVPTNVSSSFEVIIPVFFSMTIVWIIVHLLGFDINTLVADAITPLLSVSSNSLAAPLIYVTLTCVMWLFGIHPQILATIMLPIWLVNSEANMAAAQASEAIPHIGVQPFIFTFIWIGGGGGTLALCLLMCISKSKFLKKLGRLSFIPGFFNINEPLLFGLPIVLNPALAIPFALAPIVTTFVTYFAFILNIVPGMGYPLAAVWTVPSIFSAVIATASIRGAILVLVNFLIYLGIYYPFFKAYERKLVIEEE